jgi:hypothetical protein
VSGKHGGRPPATPHWGWAWVALCAALAIHVTDEALTNFLSIYNPTVLALRERFLFLPLPTFTFEGWLWGLIFGVAVLFALSPLAFRAAKWMVPVSYLFGGLMLVNGLGHLVGSIYLGRLMPGAYSAPLLLAASSFLLVRVARASRL